MKRVVLNLAAVLGIAIIALGMSRAAQANAVIDFGTGNAGTGGTYHLSGSNATGSGIPIEEVTISGAPKGNGTYELVGTASGSNAATTGPTAGCNAGGASGCASLSFNTSTNSITISGYVLGLAGYTNTTAENLLSGSFTAFSASAGGLGGPCNGGLGACGTDTKASDLLSALGLSNATFVFNGFSLTAGGVNQDGNGTAVSTDITNTQTPEPGTLVMFGSGLLGLAGLIRRKISA